MIHKNIGTNRFFSRRKYDILKSVSAQDRFHMYTLYRRKYDILKSAQDRFRMYTLYRRKYDILKSAQDRFHMYTLHSPRFNGGIGNRILDRISNITLIER